MDDKKEYIQIAEKDISLDDYPFFKLICIIGFTYGVIVLIGYIILIFSLLLALYCPLLFLGFSAVLSATSTIIRRAKII